MVPSNNMNYVEEEEINDIENTGQITANKNESGNRKIN
jgi:hypothetical protein